MLAYQNSCHLLKILALLVFVTTHVMKTLIKVINK
jgi:hypothetical protein